MEFSLIVPSVHRVQEVVRLLRSILDQRLERLRLSDIEIILVDQNSDDRLAAMTREFDSALQIQRIRIEPQGLSRAKNEGLRHATGRFLAFPDDDCWYPPETLELAYRRLIELNEEAGLFGIGFDPETQKLLLHYPLQERIIQTPDDPAVFLGLAICQFFPRRVLEKINGFDLKLGIGSSLGSGEDTDFAIRVLKAGHPIHFQSDLKVFHPAVDSQTMAPSKAMSYARGFGALCRKHGLHRHLAWKVAKQFFGAPLFLMKGDLRRTRFCLTTAIGRLRGYLEWS